MDVPAPIRLTRDLVTEGCDGGLIARRVGRQELSRVRHGAYTNELEAVAELRHRQLIAATMPRLRTEAVISHVSAGVLHGLPSWAATLSRVHITRDRTAGGHLTRNLHIHAAPLEADDITVIDGWLCTSLLRTVADLGRTLPVNRAVAVADAGLRVGLSSARLGEAVERGPQRSGVAQLRFVARFADGRAESVGESFSRVVFHQVGLPAPEPQYEVVDPNSGEVIARCDFGWQQHRTVGEFDGRIKYGRLLDPDRDAGDVVFAEKNREDRIRDVGQEMARWINADFARPQSLRERILRAFARGDRRR